MLTLKMQKKKKEKRRNVCEEHLTYPYTVKKRCFNSVIVIDEYIRQSNIYRKDEDYNLYTLFLLYGLYRIKHSTLNGVLSIAFNVSHRLFLKFFHFLKDSFAKLLPCW